MTEAGHQALAMELDTLVQGEASQKEMRGQEHNGSLSTLYEITQTLTSSLNVQDVLDLIASSSARLIETDAASLWLLDGNGGELGVAAAFGLSDEFRQGARISLGSKPSGWIAENRQSLAIGDMKLDDDASVKRLASYENVVSYLGLPLLLRGRCIGVVEVYARQNPRDFGGKDVEYLTVLGNQAVMAIENARLFQVERDTATKMRQLERHKIDFMSMVAHELRTPLTSIKGFAQLLQRQNACAKPDVVERYSTIVEAESNRMIEIINDILDISKMEAGMLEISKQPLQLSDLIRYVVDAADHLSQGHVIELSVPESLPLIRGDAAKIEQVLINLIVNAVRYSPEGEIILIGASADDDGVTVWVNDRGRGIPASKFDHIFNKYIVSDNGSDAMKSGNSGLGLYISKNFVEAHGGEMWVESEEGKGAKFLFKLRY